MIAASPLPSPHDQAYWNAAKEGRLMLQRCRDSGKFQYYPRGHSLGTGLPDLEWIESPGHGTLHTYSVVHRSFYENLPAPYVLAVVDLDEGVRVTSHIVDVDPTDVTIGMHVRATFRPRADGTPILVFTPT